MNPLRAVLFAAVALLSLSGHAATVPAGQTVTTIKVFARHFTLGVALPRGAVPAGKSLTAENVRIQLDNRASHHGDGSLAWAAVSGIFPTAVALPATVKLLLVDAPKTLPVLPPIPGPPITVTFDIWQVQRSEATFGVYQIPNSNGAAVGDAVSITLDGKSFPVTITAKEAGTTIQAMSAMGAALAAKINADPAWRATSRYHVVTVSRRDPKDGRPFTFEAGTTSPSMPVVSRRVTEGEPNTRYVATLAEAAADGVWLNGPVVQERWYRAVPVTQAGVPHPHLVVRFAERQYGETAPVNHTVTVENTKTYTAGIKTLTYDVSVKIGETVVLAAQNRQHEHHARWYRDFGPSTLAHPDWRELRRSHAVHNYRNLTLSEAMLEDMRTRLAKADNQVSGSSLVYTSMGTAGGRPDIGPLPMWHAAVIISGGDPRAWAAMMATAEASGSVPWHFFDEKKGDFVSLDDHPTVAVRHAPLADRPEDADVLPTYDASVWQPDCTHQPLLSYLPYVLTGRRQFLEELHFVANWIMIGKNPEAGYRDGAKGIFIRDETRGIAWNFRTVGHAAWITPDRHPRKAYFNAKLQNNYQAVRDRFINNPAFQAEPYKGSMPANFLAPWQEDFKVSSHALEAARGTPGAAEMLRWGAHFAAARFNRQDQGYCTDPGGVAYNMTKIARPDGKPFASWKELYDANFPGQGCKDTISIGYPATGMGYAAIARMSMELMAGFGIEDAKIGLAFLQRDPRVAEMFKGFERDPTFAIEASE
jgi:hypothetical protein